jgi:hypothetical protein
MKDRKNSPICIKKDVFRQKNRCYVVYMIAFLRSFCHTRGMSLHLWMVFSLFLGLLYLDEVRSVGTRVTGGALIGAMRMTRRETRVDRRIHKS